MGKYACNYQDSIVYKIVCNDTTVLSVYVGHTTNFASRKYCHKSACDNPRHNHIKLYATINEHGGWTNWTMVEIEKFPCSNRAEVGARERHWYEILNADLNSLYPQRTQKECVQAYTPEKKAHWDAYGVEYRKNNQEKIKQLNLDYHSRDDIKERRKERDELNSEKKKAYRKKYYDEHKNKTP